MKDQIQLTIDNLITGRMYDTNSAFPSIYSKEDVIKLLSAIKSDIYRSIESIEESKPTCDIESIKEGIRSEIVKIISDFDYSHDTEIDLLVHDRYLDVTFDCSRLQAKVEDAIDQFKINN